MGLLMIYQMQKKLNKDIFKAVHTKPIC